ncbi:hypothetical protein [Thermocoleostomius sinensis]|uniref:O-antigen ligase family protein n=1 Tax=Thermocoleostomius sinensis A174 TaxID=2016057 RepID=A0A9E8ZJ88_9CYAN|nr:hypothetical protein [Thermocoleostomius sinensis]WAL62757.1 hypothetical protein OXH18_12420 [Thermocoleostomius sinensis A174]
MVETQASKRERGQIANSILLLIAFATAFFPRILESMGVPSIINFLHFGVVPIASGIVLLQTRVRDKKQIASVQALIASLVFFFAIMLASALLNNAGFINVAMNFLLLAEAYVFLAAIVSIAPSPKSLDRFKNWILGFIALHVGLAFAQDYLIGIGQLSRGDLTDEDGVQGVFFLSNGGHVVGSFVSMAFGLYYFVSAKSVPIWIRVAVFAATFWQMLLADAKQVLMVFLGAWVLLILSRVKDPLKTLQYVILAALVFYAIFWFIFNVDHPIASAFAGWIRPEIYTPEGDATVLKLGPFRILPTFYTSSLNWFLGLGPGHTIGRLGGWMIRDYGYLLNPLGATSRPYGDAIWSTWRGHYLDSSFFSPLWGFAGIWGDLGLLGIVGYLGILYVAWQRFCLDDLSRFIILTIVVNGFIFTQLEEPAYMLSMTTLIGLRWHELHNQQRSQYYQQILDFNFRSLAQFQEQPSDREQV